MLTKAQPWGWEWLKWLKGLSAWFAYCLTWFVTEKWVELMHFHTLRPLPAAWGCTPARAQAGESLWWTGLQRQHQTPWWHRKTGNFLLSLVKDMGTPVFVSFFAAPLLGEIRTSQRHSLSTLQKCLSKLDHSQGEDILQAMAKRQAWRTHLTQGYCSGLQLHSGEPPHWRLGSRTCAQDVKGHSWETWR